MVVQYVKVKWLLIFSQIRVWWGAAVSIYVCLLMCVSICNVIWKVRSVYVAFVVSSIGKFTRDTIYKKQSAKFAAVVQVASKIVLPPEGVSFLSIGYVCIVEVSHLHQSQRVGDRVSRSKSRVWLRGISRSLPYEECLSSRSLIYTLGTWQPLLNLAYYWSCESKKTTWFPRFMNPVVCLPRSR